MEVANTWWKQFRGLMFSRKRKILFIFKHPKRVSLHSFFVFFPIRISFLDEKKRVLEEVVLKPFRVYKSKDAFKYMLEEPYK